MLCVFVLEDYADFLLSVAMPTSVSSASDVGSGMAAAEAATMSMTSLLFVPPWYVIEISNPPRFVTTCPSV